MKNIFYISGGGSEIQSEKIDRDFAKYIDGKKLMYIPIALNRNVLGFEMCYDWITKLFLRFSYNIDVPQIHMYLDPFAISEHIFEYDAIYIGGGNTFKLLDFLYKNNLFVKIREFYKMGRPVYGGSAGAIILGEDIRIIDEENDANYVYSKGFNVLDDKSFICHYEKSLDSKIMKYVLRYKQDVVALSEESGLKVVGGKIEKVFGEVFVFSGAGKKPLSIKKKVIVCDYDNPQKYTFPSFGFGSSEKRIWHFAKTLSEINGYEVIITGPLWLPEYIPNVKHFSKRLDNSTYQEFLEKFGKCDYLFAGHEYFDKDEWVKPFEMCADILFSYQLHPYKYKKISFNQQNKFLFCYSDEMVEEYKEQKPIKSLLFHSGVNEDPYFTKDKKNYLLWIGRLDQDKAPHYAILASKKNGMKIKILGKSIYQPEYFEKYKQLFLLPHVEMIGTVFGKEKMKIISEAKCAVYTIDKNYHEAGAGVLGEILASGVPIAGMSWSGKDAICEAVDHDDLGKISIMNQGFSDEEVVDKLSETISQCLTINSVNTFNIGSKKYNPKDLILKIFKKIDELRQGF